MNISTQSKQTQNGKSEVSPVTYVVPFSHLDLFWGGTREECLSRGNFIIRRALDLLEKYEDFRFLLETLNFVEHYLDCFPGEKERFGRLVAEGRLEVGTAWSGIYLNLPGGETLVRNVLLAKHYAREHFGVDPAVAHFGDLPGFTPQYPQIAALTGVRHLVMSRGGAKETPLFKWRGLNGDEVLSFYTKRGYHAYCMLSSDYAQLSEKVYHDNQKLEVTFELDAKETNYPHFAHWGLDLFAPSEQLILNVRRWNQEKRWKLRFSSLAEYFAAAETTSDLPSLSGEMPSAWPNIESSWPDLWPEDFPCEAAMQMAEFLSSLGLLHGWSDYPSALLEQAWKALLDGMDHNQNSQGGDTADRDKLQLKLWARDTASRISTQMAWRLAAQVKAPQQHAFPVVVFNSMSWRREGVVMGRAAVYGDVSPGDFPGSEHDLKLIDADGNTVPYVQLQRYKCMSNALEIAFPAKNIPAAGYQTYYLVSGKNPCREETTCSISLDAEIDAKTPQRHQGSNSYENAFFRLEIDCVTGEASVFDKRTQQTLFQKAAMVGVEERRGNYISDMTVSGRTAPALLDSIETLDNNAVWCRIRVRGSLYRMPFTQTYTLYRDFADILLENEIDWKEPRWVRLEQLFPYAEKDATIRYSVPFGQVTFPETMENLTARVGGDEIPLELRRRLRLSRQWVDVGTETGGVSIGCDHRMWEFEDGLLRSYMIRGCGYCGAVTMDPDGNPGNISRPPAGKYRFRYLLRPRCESLAQSASYRCGWELNNPTRQVTVCDTNPDGKLPAAFSLLDFTSGTAVVSAIKKTELGNAIVVRAFETAGQATEIPIPEILSTLPMETDMLEKNGRPLSSQKLTFKPFEIKTLRFQQKP